MIESDHKVNYEMAYRGACTQLDLLGAEYEKLRKLLQQTRNYVDKDHYGMLAEIDAALALGRPGNVG